MDVERDEGRRCVEHDRNDLHGAVECAFAVPIDEGDRGFEAVRLRDERGVPQVGERELEIGAARAVLPAVRADAAAPK